MNAVLINIFLAFIEGFALIISPCILPILPIILSGSLSGKKARPIGIIVGFIVTFTLVTLFSRALIEFAHISEDTLRNISFIILLLLGVMMMSSFLTDKFNLMTQRLTNIGSSISSANNPQGGFFGGVIFGGLVGIIWTPCAGPILAAVIVQVVIQQTSLSSILTVLAFAIGAGLPMLLIALLGRKIMTNFNFFRQHTTLFRKLLGLIIILSVIYLFYSTSYSAFIQSNTPQTTNTAVATKLINRLEHPYKAPEISGIDAWINSPPLTIASLKGKVILIDFWTYSCINCIRTLPYLKDWYAKYHDKGLVIIGVHSPEFQFEHDLNNVKNAVASDGILYPVALDNRFVTWQNFKNEYWPAHYLIDKKGRVVYEHFGEGEYDVTDNNIRYLLGIKEAVTQRKEEEHYSAVETPETYLGYDRGENYSSGEKVVPNKSAIYTYPATLAVDKWALNGKWIIKADKVIAASAGASIKLHFTAGKVYAVMGAPSGLVKVKLMLNGAPVTDSKGSDVADSQVQVNQQKLYALLAMQKESEGTLELTATKAGLEVYTFTFGQ